MKERIQALLGQGLAPRLVASAVGCDPAYISQLLQDQAFSLEVATLRCKDIEEIKSRDKKYDDIEDRLIKKLEDILPMMYKPYEVLLALKTINNARRRSEELIDAKNQVTNVTNIVNLHLPSRVVTQFELNKMNEVVGIEGKPLAAISTTKLMQELSEKEMQNADSHHTAKISQTQKALAESKELTRILTADSV